MSSRISKLVVASLAPPPGSVRGTPRNWWGAALPQLPVRRPCSRRLLSEFRPGPWCGRKPRCAPPSRWCRKHRVLKSAGLPACRSFRACVTSSLDVSAKLRNSTVGSIAVICLACSCRNMTAGQMESAIQPQTIGRLRKSGPRSIPTASIRSDFVQTNTASASAPSWSEGARPNRLNRELAPNTAKMRRQPKTLNNGSDGSGQRGRRSRHVEPPPPLTRPHARLPCRCRRGDGKLGAKRRGTGIAKRGDNNHRRARPPAVQYAGLPRRRRAGRPRR